MWPGMHPTGPSRPRPTACSDWPWRAAWACLRHLPEWSVVELVGDVAGWTEEQWRLLVRRLKLTRRQRGGLGGPLPTWRGAIRSHLARRCLGCGRRTTRIIDGHLMQAVHPLSPQEVLAQVTTGQARQMGFDLTGLSWWRDFYARLYFMRHLVG